MSDTETKTESQKPLSKADVIDQISRALRDRRTAQSLSLEKVTQVIKIRLPYLQALESGDWNQLPDEVFVRGFIRRYAQYLGLDGDKLIAPYLAACASPSDHKPQAPSERTSEFNRSHLVWGFLGIVFIIGFLKVIKQDRATPVKAVTPASVPALSTATPAAVITVPATSQESVKSGVSEHQMTIYSPYPLWLRVNATGKNFEGFIPQASSWNWKAEGAFTIRMGHTKQVTLLFDGKVIPLLEDQNKIVLPAE